jgi:hypothetical protein
LSWRLTGRDPTTPDDCGSMRVRSQFRAIQFFAVMRFARRVDVKQHSRWGRTYSDGRHSCSAHACRDGMVVCGRVELIVRADTRLGLAPRERRRVAARFVAHLHPVLRTELTALVAAA